MWQLPQYDCVNTSGRSVLLPVDYKANGKRRCVIAAHGLLGSALSWQSIPAMLELITFASLGFPVCSSDLGGPATWGNQTAQDAIDTDWTHMKTTYGVATDKMVLYGQSMGGPACLNYMRMKPYNVAAFAGEVAGIGLKDLHDRSAANPFDSVIGPMAGSIEAAYGGLAGYNSAIANKDPYTQVAVHALLGIPMRFWVSDDDPIWPIAIGRSFADQTGATLASIGSLGHAVLPEGFFMDVAKWMVPFVFRRQPFYQAA